MSLFLLKRLLLVYFIFSALHSLGGGRKCFLSSKKISLSLINIERNIEDTSEVKVLKHSIKICSCQVLALQSSAYRRQKNIALFAEKTNGRSFSYDMNRINRVIEKEKRHMQSFFYEKLIVMNSFTEHTDCKSLYTKLKSSNKHLILYDILNADIRH